MKGPHPVKDGGLTLSALLLFSPIRVFRPLEGGRATLKGKKTEKN